MLTLNLEQAQTLIGEIIAEYGEDKVYERPTWSSSCLYVHAEEDKLVPGCIVGVAFAKWGVPLESMESSGNGQGVCTLSGILKGDGLLSITPDALNYLDHLQGSQDNGNSWGSANQYALSRVRGDS